MAKLSKQEITAAAIQALEDSEGYDTDELNGLRADALDYYYNRERIAPSMSGRSKLQASTVSDMVEHVSAQIMPAFDGSNIVEFEPTSEDDVEQARVETDACMYVMKQQNNGYIDIQESIRDALLLRNGIMKVYLSETEDIRTETYEMLTRDQYGKMNLEAVDSIRDVDNGYSLEVLTEHPGEFYDVKLRIKTTDRQVCCKAVDPGNFSWERDHNSIFLDRVRFCAERYMKTRSELIEMGYKKSVVNALNKGGNDTRIDDLARSQNSYQRNYEGATPAEDLIEVYEVYMRIDADGDGIAELNRIVLADREILEREEVDYIPYASGTPFIQPHRFNGLGLFDKLRHIQDQQTFGIRQWADNLNNTNNVRIGVVDGSVNIDDVVNSRPGGVIRMRDPNAIIPLPVTDAGVSAQAFLSYGDKLRSERAGAAIDMATAEMQVAGSTAHGVERQMSAHEQMAAFMTRTLAETLIRETFKLIHKALRLYIPDAFEFPVEGKFVVADPSQWRERKNVAVKSGLSVAERRRKVTSLEALIMRQDALQQQGKFVSPDSIYSAHCDWLKAQDMDAPQRYLDDPEGQEAQQWNEQQAQAQQQQMQYQQQLLEMQQMIEQRNAENADAKVLEDARQFDENLQYEYWKVAQEQEAKEAELVQKTVMDMVSNERGAQQGDTDNGKSAVRAVNG